MGEPHFSHFSSVSTGSSLGGGGGALSFNSSGSGLALRHFGYPEQARNGPRRLLRISIGEPHFSHLMSVVTGSGFSITVILPSASRVNDFAFRHFGYPEQARNSPRLLALITIAEPHFSHLMPVS